MFTPQTKRIKLDSVDAQSTASSTIKYLDGQDKATHLEKETSFTFAVEDTLEQAKTPEIPFNFAFNRLNDNNIFGNDDDDDAALINDEDNDILLDDKNENFGAIDENQKENLIKSSEGTALNENNVDDDDDVIEVKTKRVIVQIIDNDDDEETQWVDTFPNDDEVIEQKVEPIIVDDGENEEEICSSSVTSSDTDTTSSRRKVLPSCVTSSTNEYVDGHWVNHSTIDINILYENAAKIKVEPRDAEDGDDDYDCFEDIGEIFPYDEPGTTETAENRSPETTASIQQAERKTSPTTSEVVTMDGEIIYRPVERKIYNEIKINSKTIRVIPRGSRPTEPIPPIRKIRPKIVADETSAMCTIM